MREMLAAMMVAVLVVLLLGLTISTIAIIMREVVLAPIGITITFEQAFGIVVGILLLKYLIK